MKKNPAALFNFTALSKFVLASKDDTNKDVLCFCLPAFAEAIWDLTDSILADKPGDNVVEQSLPFHSPNIRTAFNLYLNLPEDSPIKTFSQSCFMDPFGHSDSTVIAFMAQKVDPATSGDSDGPKTPLRGLLRRLSAIFGRGR